MAFARFAILTFALGYAALSQASAAELKGYAETCPVTKQLCFWHQAVVEPPRGWIEDKAWTRRYKATMLFENGDKSQKKPVMYLRTHKGDGTMSLDHYIRGAQEGWKKTVPDNSIEQLEDFALPGKPAFKVYLYRNPSRPVMAFELTAFTKDVDAAYPEDTFFFQAVLSSPSMEELERTKPAFYELLANFH
jgi:hypothetical protein